MKELKMVNKYDVKSVGERIYQTRTQMGKKFTQDYVSEQCGCIRQTYAKWEQGEKLPKIDEFIKLCNAFECDIGYLLCEYDTKRHIAADVKGATGLNEDTFVVLRNNTEKSTLYHDTINCVLTEMLSSSQYLIYLTALTELTGACQLLLEDEEKHRQSGSNSSSESFLIHETVAIKEKEATEYQLSKIVQEMQRNIIETLVLYPEFKDKAKSFKNSFIQKFNEMYRKEL